MTTRPPAPLSRLLQPFNEFVHTQAAGGIVLLLATVLALAWANSPWSAAYEAMRHTHLVLDVGLIRLDESVHEWVNDGAMVLFFFLVGLEIKRELTVGEINSVRRAVVPVAAALGGMVAPVLIFLLVVTDAAARPGWGVPMATDIAFALGIVALLGRRVPDGLKVLLLALAIFDDIGAVAVIAVAYSDAAAALPLVAAAAVLAVMWICSRLGVRGIGAYVALGILAWLAARESGVHPALLGVAFGLLTPWESWHHPEHFAREADRLLRELRERIGTPDERRSRTEAVLHLRSLSAEAIAPLDRLEATLTDWVAFLVVPLFALVNAGVDLRGGALDDATGAPLAWGVALGLVLGKPAGIVAGCWLALRLGAELPAGATWRGVLGVGAVAGIGFTVALFVAQLAYADTGLLAHAKVGVFAGSLVSGVLGYLLLRSLPETSDAEGI